MCGFFVVFFLWVVPWGLLGSFLGVVLLLFVLAVWVLCWVFLVRVFVWCGLGLFAFLLEAFALGFWFFVLCFLLVCVCFLLVGLVSVCLSGGVSVGYGRRGACMLRFLILCVQVLCGSGRFGFLSGFLVIVSSLGFVFVCFG